ncbi:MAG TPA: hypothetical protein VGQ87_00785 [Patescibacteria group bacterium]|jgi:hypothetical protein|nr:hypothetical protein [Patescibacteria group bacterium]
MQKQPKVIEVRMGNLVFITNQGLLTTYDPDTKRFDRSVTTVTPEHKFIMAMSTCGGIFVRNQQENAAIPFALAHMPSSEMARKMGNLSYAQVREHLRQEHVRQEIRDLLKQVGTLAPELADEMRASLYSPIFGPDLLAERVLESMGQLVEVYVFGGMLDKGQKVPAVVKGLDEEFRKRKVKTIIEHSVVDLHRFNRMAMIRPYVSDPTDFVRPCSKIVNEPMMVLQLTASEQTG